MNIEIETLITNKFCIQTDSEEKKQWKCILCLSFINHNQKHCNRYHKDLVDIIGSMKKEQKNLVVQTMINMFLSYENSKIKLEPKQTMETCPKQSVYDGNGENLASELMYYISLLSSEYNLSFKSCSLFSSFINYLCLSLRLWENISIQTLKNIGEKINLKKTDKISEKVNDIGRQLRSYTFEKLKTCDNFVLQMDETTDVTGVSKTVVHANIFIKDGSEYHVEQLFIGLYSNEGNKTDAYSLLNNLITCFSYNNNNYLYKVIGITTDGGSNMNKLKNIMKKIFIKNERVILDLKCFLHCENLIASSINDLGCMEVVDMIVQYVNRSFKRKIQLRSQLEQFHSYGDIPKYATTRWLTRFKTVDRIIESMKELIEFIQMDIDSNFNGKEMSIKEIKKVNPSIATLLEEKESYTGNEECIFEDEEIEEIEVEMTTEKCKDTKKKESKKGRKKWDGEDEATTFPLFIYLLKNEKIQRDLVFFSEILKQHNSISLENQKQEKKIDEIFNQIESFNKIFETMKFDLQKLNFKSEILPKFMEVIQQSKCYESEKWKEEVDKYVSVIDGIIEKAKEKFKTFEFIKLINETISNGSCDDTTLSNISEYLTGNVELASERLKEKKKLKQSIEEQLKKDEEIEQKLISILKNGKKLDDEKKIIKNEFLRESKSDSILLPPISELDFPMKRRKDSFTIPKEITEKKQQSIIDSTSLINSYKMNKQQLPLINTLFYFEKPKLETLNPISFEQESEKINQALKKLSKEMTSFHSTNTSQKPITFPTQRLDKIPIKDELKIQLRKEFDQLQQSMEMDKIGMIKRNEETFKLLSQIVHSINISFPTTVICESSFSIMKYIKSETRNRMKDETLQSIMRMKYSSHDETLKAIEEIINMKIQSRKSRRLSSKQFQAVYKIDEN